MCKQYFFMWFVVFLFFVTVFCWCFGSVFYCVFSFVCINRGWGVVLVKKSVKA